MRQLPFRFPGKGGEKMEQIVTGEQMKALDVYTIEQMQMPSLVLSLIHISTE